jgi:hypothetical protein
MPNADRMSKKRSALRRDPRSRRAEFTPKPPPAIEAAPFSFRPFSFGRAKEKGHNWLDPPRVTHTPGSGHKSYPFYTANL